MNNKPPKNQSAPSDREFAVILESIRSEFRTFGETLSEVKTKQDTMYEEMGRHREDITIIKVDMRFMKADIKELKTDVAVLQEDVSSIKGRLTNVETDISVMKGDIRYMKDDIRYMKDDIRFIKNDHGSRLTALEAASTAKPE